MSEVLRIFFFLFFLFAPFKFFFAQNFTYYSQKNGLADSYVMSIFQDSKDYLWFGTQNGLSRFDGIEFKSFKKKDGLPGNIVTTITETHDGHLWIGTFASGVSCFSNGRFKNFATPQGFIEAQVNSIKEDKNNVIWLGTDKGLFSFDGITFRKYTGTDGLYSTAIKGITVTGNGKLWVTTNDGIYSYHKNRFTNYSKEDGLIGNNAKVILADSQDRLWIGTDNGLSCLKNGTFFSYTTNTGLAHNCVIAMTEDKNGNIWFGTTGGLSFFSKGKFFSYTTKDGLPENVVTSLFQDREGNMWIASSLGVSRLNSLKIRRYSEKDGLCNNGVAKIIEDKNNQYWFGTTLGLSHRFNGQFKNFFTTNGLINDCINSLIEDRYGNIWCATTDGLSVLSPSGNFMNYTSRHGLYSNIIFDLLEDHDGAIWICTRMGLNRYIKGKFFAPPFKIKPSLVYRILEDCKKNLWFSVLGGIYKYSTTKKKLSCYTQRDGVPNTLIMSIFEDSRGRIWIGTEEGLSYYSNGSFLKFLKTDGSSFDYCRTILEDKQGSMWFGTSEGLVCYDGNTLKTYTSKSHGLVADAFDSGIVDSRGALWLASTEGINTFTPPLETNSAPPGVHITSVKVVGQEIPIQGSQQFHHHRNNFKFDFVGLCFTAPESVTYKFQLKGMDMNWLDTKERTVFYPYLPPGNYTFRVKAYNNDRVESKKLAMFSFQIHPPYWRTWWFYTISFLFLVLSIFLFLLWGIKRAEEKKTLKARTRQLMMSQRMELMGMLAAGAVHDMKNLMGIIIGYSDIVKSDARIDDKNNRMLVYIIETATTAAQMVKQILEFSRPKLSASSTAANMVLLMDEILELLRVTTHDQIKLVWVPPKEEILFKINPIHLQQIVMNLCINAVHAMPTGGVLDISLTKDTENEALLKISDTGSGIKQELLEKIFDPLFTTKGNDKGTGLGLFVVRQLVTDYNGNISVHSQPGKGSTFTISWPQKD